MSKTIILIPSRLKATRLPNKPLLKINGISIIQHAYNRALESDVGKVVVVTGDKEIEANIKSTDGNVILTNKHHLTGTDRINEALEKIKNRHDFDYIINLQGDEPFLSPEDISNLNKYTRQSNSDIGTLGCKLNQKNDLNDRNIVKVVTNENLNKKNISRALSFFRINKNIKNVNIYQHIGIYQFKNSVLKKFTKLNQSKNEIKYSLEQYRAIDNNISIDVVHAKKPSVGIDTMDDYVEIKKIMEYKS